MIKTSKIYKMRIVFQWAPDAPGRLDSVEVLRKMLLASKLPCARAKQHVWAPRLAYGPAVKRGQFAEREYADIYLLDAVDSAQVRTALDQCRPAGLTILAVNRVPYALAGVQQLASAAVYQAQGDFNSFSPIQTIENYVNATRLESTLRAANGMCFTRDIKPYVLRAQTLAPDYVEFTLRSVEGKWMNPVELLYGWLDIQDVATEENMPDERFKIIRKGLYWTDSQHNLHLI